FSTATATQDSTEALEREAEYGTRRHRPRSFRCGEIPVERMRGHAVTPRANWKGVLKVGEVTCHVALYTAASTSERISFHTINRATGHRVHRQFVDSDTGKPVERDDQVKG